MKLNLWGLKMMALQMCTPWPIFHLESRWNPVKQTHVAKNLEQEIDVKLFTWVSAVVMAKTNSWFTRYT